MLRPVKRSKREIINISSSDVSALWGYSGQVLYKYDAETDSYVRPMRTAQNTSLTLSPVMGTIDLYSNDVKQFPITVRNGYTGTMNMLSMPIELVSSMFGYDELEDGYIAKTSGQGDFFAISTVQTGQSKTLGDFFEVTLFFKVSFGEAGIDMTSNTDNGSRADISIPITVLPAEYTKNGTTEIGSFVKKRFKTRAEVEEFQSTVITEFVDTPDTPDGGDGGDTIPPEKPTVQIVEVKHDTTSISVVGMITDADESYIRIFEGTDELYSKKLAIPNGGVDETITYADAGIVYDEEELAVTYTVILEGNNEAGTTAKEQTHVIP